MQPVHMGLKALQFEQQLLPLPSATVAAAPPASSARTHGAAPSPAIVAARLRRLRAITPVPLVAGFGVRTPETFAALYAGLAATEVQEHIDKDSQGRVTYKGKVVQMYPIRRLTQLFKERLKYSGEETAP